MQVNVSFKQIPPSSQVVEYAEKKIRQKVEQLTTKPIEAQITLYTEALDMVAHCQIKGGDGFNCQVESRSEDLLSSIDLVIDKIGVIMKRKKEKLKNHKKSNNRKRKQVLSFPKSIDETECDDIPVDAGDLIKYEKKRKQLFG